MERRALGRGGRLVSALGLGCGAVGGAMIHGSRIERERLVGRALDAGVDHFDTAPSYGEGASERHLGEALAALRPARALVSTKAFVRTGDEPAHAVARSVEASLRRLRRERIDLLYVHNALGATADGEGLGADRLARVVDALDALRAQGKVDRIGFGAIGDTAALHAAAASGRFDAAQVVYSALNPSAATAPPPGMRGQDHGRLLDRLEECGVGAIAIRVLAGGALSGEAARHAYAKPPGRGYAANVERARRLARLVAEGFVATPAEAAIRFALSHRAVAAALVGVASEAELDAAVAAARNGPLPPEAMALAATLPFEGDAAP